MSTYTIREMEPEDDASALEAWNRAFARGDGSKGRASADWDWSYARNPAGRRGFVAEHAGQVVALYAALPVKVQVEGREHTFAQIVDSLVLPEHRAGLKRPGLFVDVGRSFFKRYGAAEKDVVFFGWPVDAAWRAGSRFLNYATLRQEILLGREPGAGSREIPTAVERIERFDTGARALYDRACGRYGASTIRDARFLDWRVVDRPGVEYRRFGVRDARGEWRGIAVQRTCAFVLPEASVIVDWIVPEGEWDVAQALLEAILAETRADQAQTVCALVPVWSDWFRWFQTQGFLAHPADFVVAGRSFSDQYDVDWLRERWWYTLIDSDLV